MNGKIKLFATRTGTGESCKFYWVVIIYSISATEVPSLPEVGPTWFALLITGYERKSVMLTHIFLFIHIVL